MNSPSSGDTIWQQEKWSALEKIIFRFGFVYLALYILPSFISFFSSILLSEDANILKPLVLWVGEEVFSNDNISVMPNGSGDTTYNYVEVFTIFAIALIATLVWTIADRNREEYRRLLYWLTVGVRYMLGITMLTYGLVKVFKSQFPEPSLVSLLQPLGETSPMGLLWKFMGFSTAYNIFTGLGETIGGLLLFFRRTTTLGAMLLMAVLSNVVILNFSYDVPVKLFSSHLLVMALLLFLLDAKRVMNLLLFNRPVSPVQYPLSFQDPRLRRGGLILKGIVVLGMVVAVTYQSVSMYRQYGGTQARPPLFGIYEVEQFVMNRDTLPEGAADSTRWKRVVIDTHNRFHIQDMQDNFVYYKFELDTATQTFTITPSRLNDPLYRVAYEVDSIQNLKVSGVKRADSIFVRMKHLDYDDFLLTNRGFHWVNEYPFNR